MIVNLEFFCTRSGILSRDDDRLLFPLFLSVIERCTVPDHCIPYPYSYPAPRKPTKNPSSTFSLSLFPFQLILFIFFLTWHVQKRENKLKGKGRASLSFSTFLIIHASLFFLINRCFTEAFFSFRLGKTILFLNTEKKRHSFRYMIMPLSPLPPHLSAHIYSVPYV